MDLLDFGDLIVTCLSEHSRNRKAGKLIGQGKTIEDCFQIAKQITGKDYSTKTNII